MAMLDLLLCLLTYIILTFLMMVLLRKRRNDSGNDDGDGGTKIDKTPTIDLPPGTSWPIDPESKIKEKETEHVFEMQ